MRKLVVFNQLSLDGYIATESGDMNWAHKPPDDTEWNSFVSQNASGGGTLLFGRVTYEMMASFWPTPMAAQMNPDVAKQMNALPKVVFSRSMAEAKWSNTTLVKTDLVAAVCDLKNTPGPGMAILGSASIVSPLAQAGLVDEFQLCINPIVLGKGKALFGGVDGRLRLTLTKSRVFSNGTVLLCYTPTARAE